ncbi:uncharacterized protein DNG_03742 [Cephalotrichum gorgonifer]|uniref:Uncharacterized protein n=1 Tax=Cephalotrichum gorgonifer TaxID=2041049 RepID=A0AAE8MVL6_9PEZI|nr:uncharacterized protein DNG_03742 [Cephalotrichum gorgonifer]
MAELDFLTDPATMAHPISLTGQPQTQSQSEAQAQAQAQAQLDPAHLFPGGPDRPSNLAIGVELKFLVPFLKEGSPDPSPADHRPISRTPHIHADANADAGSPSAAASALLLQQAYHVVASAIESAHQRAIAITEIASRDRQESDFWAEHWIVKKSNSSAPGPEDEARDRGACVYAPLEISSPRMSALDPRTYDVVRAVVRALATRCRLVVNYTCEMHVHVGRYDGLPLSMPSLRNVAALCWLAEPVLRLLKDPASPNFHHLYTWSSPLRQHSRLAGMVSSSAGNGGGGGSGGDRPDATARDDSVALRAIYDAADPRTLGRLLSGVEKRYRRLGFNFSAFGLEDERAVRSPRSVEVRFFEDYRGEDEVLGWMAVCVALAAVAVEERRDRFCWIVDALTGRPDAAARRTPAERMRALLGMLGLEERVVKMFADRVEGIYSKSLD